MHPITILGLALCLAVLFHKARKARLLQRRSSTKSRFKTARLLLGAILVWLVISMNLKHLDHSFSGGPQDPQSTWDRVVQTLSDLLL